MTAPTRMLADPQGGCACTPHWQDAGAGYTEFVPEYEPDCPVHSYHLYDPRNGEWIIDPRGAADRSDAGPLGSGHSPSVETADEREDSGGSVEEPSTHLIHGPASTPPTYDWEYGVTSKWGTITRHSQAAAEAFASNLRESITAGHESGDTRFHGIVMRRTAAVAPGPWEAVSSDVEVRS